MRAVRYFPKVEIPQKIPPKKTHWRFLGEDFFAEGDGAQRTASDFIAVGEFSCLITGRTSIIRIPFCFGFSNLQ